MKKFCVFLTCVISLVITAGSVKAVESRIKDITIEKKKTEVKITFETEGDCEIIAYDIIQPPQVIVDVIGDGLTDLDEDIPVYCAGIEKMTVIKSPFETKDYYGVDFWTIKLSEPLYYELSRYNDTYTLILTKSGIVNSDTRTVTEKIPLQTQETAMQVSKEACIPSATTAPVSTYNPREQALQLRQEGYRYQMEGKYKNALEYYQKALDEDPCYATVYNDLGIIYYKYMNEVEKAIERFEKALEIDPYYLSAHTNLALIYELLDEKEIACKHWKERARLGKPDDYWTKLAKEKLERSESQD